MKYFLTLSLFLVSSVSLSQVVGFNLVDYQRIIAPKQLELNSSIELDLVDYEQNPVTKENIAYGFKGKRWEYIFDFNTMTCSNVTYDGTANGVITSILFQEDGIDFPSQFTVLWDGSDNETMYCYTFTEFGDEVFLSFYDKDVHPWNDESPWDSESFITGYFSKHFNLTFYD